MIAIDTEFIVRFISLIITILIHIGLIYVTPEKIRDLINDLIKDLIRTGNWKKTVIAGGLAGVFLLTLYSVFSLSILTIANFLLNESGSIQNILFIFTLIGVFLFIISFGFIFDYFEGEYQKTTERQAELLSND